MEKRTILFVDDEVENRRMAPRQLASLDCMVTVAENGAAALKILRFAQVHLVITDNSMPEMTGTELAKEMRGDPTLKDIPIIMVTGDSNFQKPVTVDWMLDKPYELKALVGLAKICLDQ